MAASPKLAGDVILGPGADGKDDGEADDVAGAGDGIGEEIELDDERAFLEAIAGIGAEGGAVAINVLFLHGFAVDGVAEVFVALVGRADARNIEALNEGVEDGGAAVREKWVRLHVAGAAVSNGAAEEGRVMWKAGRRERNRFECPKRKTTEEG